MKRKTIFFLMVVMVVLTVLIYGTVNGQQALVQLGLGGLGLYMVLDWLIPALRRPPTERPATEEGPATYEHS